MEEKRVREQLETALTMYDEALEAPSERREVPDFQSFEEAGLCTSDDGILLSYQDGSQFAIHVACQRRADVPNEEDV